MKHLKNARFPFPAVAMLPLHMGHEGSLLQQDLPPLLLRVFSKYEHLFMRGVNYLATRDWIYGHALTRRLVDAVGDRLTAYVNGEVLTLDEVKEMIKAVSAGGYTVAVGTCPCRRARNELSNEVPNNTDMVFGLWADQYVRNYPGLYHRVSPEEALELVEDFDRHGFVHQVYGVGGRAGAAYVLCNCSPDVCVPLLAQKTRGIQAFRKGRSEASVEAAACLGIEECGACLERCPFDARFSRKDKSAVNADLCFGCGLCVSTCRGKATTLKRRPGAELVYTRDLVS